MEASTQGMRNSRALAAHEAKRSANREQRRAVRTYLESLGISENDHHHEAARAIRAGTARGKIDPPKGVLDAAKLVLDHHRWETEMKKGKAPQRHQVHATIGVLTTSKLAGQLPEHGPTPDELPGVSSPLDIVVEGEGESP